VIFVVAETLRQKQAKSPDDRFEPLQLLRKVEIEAVQLLDSHGTYSDLQGASNAGLGFARSHPHGVTCTKISQVKRFAIFI
jgi:hypothetical protein